MKHLKTLGLASALALAGWAAQAQSLRFAHPVPESDVQHVMATFFAEEVAARSNGAVTVQIFPQGQLGNDAAMIDGARSGIIAIVLVGLNTLTGLVPEAGVFELPFMFPERELAYAALLMMNAASFDRLSPENQAIVREMAAEAVAMQRVMAAERKETMVAELVERGLELNTDVDAAAFQAAVTPVWDAFIAANGDAEVKAIMAIQQ